MNGAPGVLVAGIGLAFGERSVFERLTLTFGGGRWHAVLGRSGTGKSTLLRLIAGLARADGGTVRADDGASLAPRLALMAQDDALLPWLDVVDNVRLGVRLRGERRAGSRRAALAILERVGLADSADALPATLSGGMRQRVALARTLFEDRPLVLMDEPFSRLDAITRRELQDLAHTLLHGRTVVLVTHDPNEALRLADTVTVLGEAAGGTAFRMEPDGATPRDDRSVAALGGERALWHALGSSGSSATPSSEVTG